MEPALGKLEEETEQEVLASLSFLELELTAPRQACAPRAGALRQVKMLAMEKLGCTGRQGDIQDRHLLAMTPRNHHYLDIENFRGARVLRPKLRVLFRGQVVMGLWGGATNLAPKAQKISGIRKVAYKSSGEGMATAQLEPWAGQRKVPEVSSFLRAGQWDRGKQGHQSVKTWALRMTHGPISER